MIVNLNKKFKNFNYKEIDKIRRFIIAYDIYHEIDRVDEIGAKELSEIIINIYLHDDILDIDTITNAIAIMINKDNIKVEDIKKMDIYDLKERIGRY